ncbi:molybdopterin molybdenumtransferase MoeA, partial [Rhizobiaceae sp. 2RAB30]
GAEAGAAETIPLHDAAGRVLAAPLKAQRTQPPFPASAMDGYAVRAADIATTPARLRIVGEAPAGRLFQGKVATGEAVRIFTGAPVPDGADTI